MGNSNLNRLMNRFSICTIFLALALLSTYAKAEVAADDADAAATDAVEEVAAEEREPAQAQPRKKATRPRRRSAQPARAQEVAPPPATEAVAQTSAAPPAAKNPFSTSVEFTTGEDDNFLESSRSGMAGTFYEIKPAIAFKTDGGFLGEVGVRLLDYTGEVESDLGKETEASLALGYETTLWGETISGSKVSMTYSDVRREDEIALPIDSMAVQSTSYKLEQNLAWDLGGLKVNAAGAYEMNNGQSINKFAPEIFGTNPVEADFNKASANVKVTIPLTPSISIEAVPAISHKRYDEQKGRETDGSGSAYIPGSPNREYLDNELAVNVPMKFGVLSLTPTVISGITSDRANGGEDHTFIKAQIAAALNFENLNNLALAMSYSLKSKSYDNWIDDIVPAGAKREDDDSKVEIGANVDIMQNLNFGLNWTFIKEESNMQVSNTWENYERNVTAAKLTLKF